MIEVVSGARQAARPGSPTKLIAGVAATALVVVIAAFALQFLLPAQLLAQALSAQISKATGLSAKIGGTSELRIFPRPCVIVENIHLADTRRGVAIDIPKIIGFVRFLPLVAGRVEIGRTVLLNPNFSIDFTQLQIGGAAISNPASNNMNAQAFREPLGELSIVDGHALIMPAKTPSKVALDAINMHVNWPRLEGSAEFGGSLDFHGLSVHLEGWLEQPLAVLHGHDSNGVFQLKSAALNFWSSGRLAATPKFQYHGSISASAPSLRGVAEIAGYSFTKRGTFADLDLTCDVTYDAISAALTNVDLKLDGNDYEGTLDIQDLAHVPRISGTLASEFIDVTPFLTGLKEPAAQDGLWSRKPLEFGNLGLPLLDLRVSAARLKLYDLQAENAALSLLTKPGLIDLDLPEATSNSGSVKGHFKLTEKDHKFYSELIGEGRGIDIQPMIFEKQRPLSGSLDASLALESSGEDLDALMHGLTGQATLVAHNGAFTNVDLVSTLEHAVTKKTGDEISAVTGTTAFDRLALDLSIARGRALVKSGEISGPGILFKLGGTLDMGQRELDILSRAQISEISAKTSRISPAHFELKGRWADLHFYQAADTLRLPSYPKQQDALPNATLLPLPTQE